MRRLSLGKAVRSRHVDNYMRSAGYRRAVCFSCGNAAEALRRSGVDVLEVGPRGRLLPGGWWSCGEIRRAWPEYFDATSGHLPVALMTAIGAELVDGIGSVFPGEEVIVPSGSGETLVCLALAYRRGEGPRLVAEYDCGRPETMYDPEAPLAPLVRALAHDVRILR